MTMTLHKGETPWFQRVALLVIIIVAAVLRFQHIKQPFTDYISWRQTSCAMMAENFYRTSWNIFYPEVNWVGPGPGYQGREFQTVTYIAALLYPILGQQDWVGRTIAALFGLWAIFALYQLVRRLWDTECALAAAAVAAVAPSNIFFDRSFLPDPAMVSLVLTACWMLLAYLQSQQARYLALSAATACLGFATKLPGLVALVPMIYAACVIARRLPCGRLMTARLGPVAAVSLLPIAGYYLWALHLGHTYPPYHIAGGGTFIWDNGLTDLWQSRFYLPALCWNASWMWDGPLLLLAIAGPLLQLASDWRERSSQTQKEHASSEARFFFHWWLAASAVFYLLSAKEVASNCWNLYIINPALCAFAGFTIVRGASLPAFPRRGLWRLAVGIVVISVIFVSGEYRLRDKYHPGSPLDATQSYLLGLALREATKPGDLVVTVSNDIGSPVSIYYSRRRGWVFPPPWPEVQWWSAIPEDENDLIRWLDQLRSRGGRWLGIVEERRAEIWQRRPAFARHVEQTCALYRKNPEWVIYKMEAQPAGNSSFSGLNPRPDEATL